MIAFEAFERELARPMRTAAGTQRSRAGFVVRYRDGLGEATPMEPWTEAYADTRTALERAASHTSPAGALAAVDHHPAARHGVAQAVIDHRARAAGRPFYRQLGGSRRVDAVAVNAVVDADSPEAVAQAGESAREAGFRTVKLKVGAATPARDLRRARRLHGAVGGDVAVRLDANGAWDRKTVDAHVEAIAALDVSVFEQPTPGIDPAVIDRLQRHDVGVALDEALATGSVTAGLRSGVDVFVVKPMACGGPDRARAIARTARTCGIEPIISDLLGGGVARHGATHVVASLGVDQPAAGLATGAYLRRDLVADPPRPTDGHLEVTHAPGLGDLEVTAGD